MVLFRKLKLGILDKFIGDAVMAVFGVPFGTPEDPINSCNAALRMKESVKILNEQRNSIGLKGISIGIGINTGLVIIYILNYRCYQETLDPKSVWNIAV